MSNQLSDLFSASILTQKQVHQLQQASIQTPQQIIDRVKTPDALDDLSNVSGISQTELIIIAAGANLYSLRGAGVEIAKKVIDDIDWQDIDDSDQDFIELLHELALADHVSLRQWLLYEFVGVNTSGPPKLTMQRYAWGLAGLFLVGLWLYGLYESRFTLFFPQMGVSVMDQAFLDLDRTLQWHFFLLQPVLVLIFGMLIPINELGSVINFHVTTWLSMHIAKDTDRLLVVDTFLRMSPGQQRVLRMGPNVASVLLYASLFILVAINLPEFGLNHIGWTIGGGVLFCVSLLGGWIWFQIVGFEDFRNGILVGTLQRYASERISALIVTIMIFLTSFGLLGVFVTDIAGPRLFEYSNNYISQSESDFRSSIMQADLDKAERRDWLVFGHQHAATIRSQILNEFTTVTTVWAKTLPVLNWAMLIALFVLSVGEYLFVSRRQGGLALLIALLTFLTSEYGVDLVLNLEPISPIVKLAVSGLGGSLTVAVVGELWGLGADKTNTTVCDICGLFVEDGDAHCRHCGAKLVPSTL